MTIKKKTTMLAQVGSGIANASSATAKPVWDNIKNWALEYSLLPLSALVVLLLIRFSTYLNNGRAPTENADSLVGLAFRILDIVIILITLSLAKELVGHWYTKEEIKKQPMLPWPSTVTTIAIIFAFTYLLTR